jgi:hypothetical protein
MWWKRDRFDGPTPGLGIVTGGDDITRGLRSVAQSYDEATMTRDRDRYLAEADKPAPERARDVLDELHEIRRGIRTLIWLVAATNTLIIIALTKLIAG